VVEEPQSKKSKARVAMMTTLSITILEEYSKVIKQSMTAEKIRKLEELNELVFRNNGT
jgi:hypothetical protein